MSENEADAESEAEAAETESGIQEGDFVRIDYNVRTVSDDRVVDTTRKDVAEEAGIDDDEYDFSPRIIVVGEGHVFPGVDDALIGGEVGDEGTVEIDAEDGFGEYDQEQVRTVSANKLDEENRRPGAQVQIDGDQGYVERVIGGRARVDFNHPLAGEDLEYEYEIVDVVEDDEEKAKGLLGMYLQMEPDLRIETETVEETVEDEDGEETTEEVEQRSLYIEATQQMQMNQQWMFQKSQVAQDLMDRLDLDRVVVEEVFDGSGGGMMGGMGGMMGGMGGAEQIEEEIEDIEEDLEDADVDAEEIVDELEDE
ncbi:FKBP-type peptidyl-prolyl cis-trans isomerase [Halolamina sp. C58]|uniref:FKBP-type peptidyl-prolyl cis-trans isomerase n=1 Tax=Halolamina sp. C58 TaxID=3421640 RepID=UPI003EC12565